MPGRSASVREPTIFGQLLQAARKQAGIRLMAEAARRAGRSKSYYWRLEHTAIEPGWWTVCDLIDCLKLPLECFFSADTILAAATRIQRQPILTTDPSQGTPTDALPETSLPAIEPPARSTAGD